MQEDRGQGELHDLHAPDDGTDSRHGSRSLTDAFVAEEERRPRTGRGQWVEVPDTIT